VGRGAWLRAWINKLIPPCLGGLAGSGIERTLLAAGFHRAPVCARRPVVRRALRLSRPLSSSCIQFFSPTWGFGVSVPGPDDAISFQIGAAIFTFAVLGILFTWRTAGRLRWEIGYFITGTLAALFVSSVWAPPLWEMPLLGGLLQSAQFPWRWLVIATRRRQRAGRADRPSRGACANAGGCRCRCWLS
jgi:hypothetical protein